MKKSSSLTLTELTKSKSTLNGVLIGFAVLGVIGAVTLYVLKAEPILYLPVLVLPITWVPLLISLKSVNDEIKKRNTENTRG
ncbi:hypothetical protein ACS5PU_10910 [Pedobacter sp. GSP4]|uniref:hypothetical protein n=1 Tax=Pedobacter sp. GSP4 TaxID=3453716 RepID=UPI003EEDF446